MCVYIYTHTQTTSFALLCLSPRKPLAFLSNQLCFMTKLHWLRRLCRGYTLLPSHCVCAFVSHPQSLYLYQHRKNQKMFSISLQQKGTHTHTDANTHYTFSVLHFKLENCYCQKRQLKMRANSEGRYIVKSKEKNERLDKTLRSWNDVKRWDTHIPPDIQAHKER